MTTMISEVYDASKDSQGVSDEKARKAAEAVAQYDARFTELKASADAFRADVNIKFEGINTKFEGINTKIEALRGEMKAEFAAQGGRITLLYWALMLIVSGVVALLLKAFLA